MENEFVYEADRFEYLELERRICEHCAIEYPDSSNTPKALPLGKSVTIRVYTMHKHPHKSVQCQVRMSKKQNSEKYLIEVYDIHFI